MWWWILVAIIGAALVYAYRDHTKHSRRLTALFAKRAARHGGTVKPGTILAYPQLRFEDGERRFFATAMAGSGAHEAPSGPFTLVDLTLPFDTGEELRIARRDARPMAETKPFDQAYKIVGDGAFARSLLDAAVRDRLAGTGLAKLGIRVKGDKIGVHMNGLADSEAALQDLIDTASLIADRCRRPQEG